MAFMVPFLPYLAAAGAAVTAAGAIQQGEAQHDASRHNAKVMAMQAASAYQQAGQREEQVRREAGQVLGEQRAAIAQAGGGFGGSAADIMHQSAVDAELDALNQRYAGQLEAWGLNAQAENERYMGRAARRSGYFKAAGSVLSAAGYYARGKKLPGDGEET